MNGDLMLPVRHRVTDRRPETADCATITLEPFGAALPAFVPGQFTMLYAPGVGEVAISISGDPSTVDGAIVQTIRDVGAVSHALSSAVPGAVLGVRGPYGAGWDVAASAGRDLVIVAGGVGLAPLRPVVLSALARRTAYGRVMLIAGARTPADFLFREQLHAWSRRGDLDVRLTVDRPAAGWTGRVGFVTEPLAALELDPARTTAFLCGPEPMMRFSARVLLRAGMSPTDIRVSLERNMKCGVALCGHCQLGELLVCRDGPVVDYRVAEPLLTVPEL